MGFGDCTARCVMPCLLLDGDEDGVTVDRYGMENMAMFHIRF